MKRSEAIDQLREMDAKYSCYVYCKNELAVVLGEQGQKLNRTLSSLASAKALVRAARGVYVFAYSSHLGEGTLHQVAKRLRSGELVWESLESALSRWNVISQIPVDRVTFMTTGREGEFRTAYGVIEFTHCKLSWSRILPNLIEAAGRNANRGFPDVALFEIGGLVLITPPFAWASGVPASESIGLLAVIALLAALWNAVYNTS